MDSVLKKGLFLVTISSLVMGISPEVQAADTDSVLPGAGIEEVLNDYDASDHKVQVKSIWFQQRRVSIQIWHLRMFIRFFI